MATPKSKRKLVGKKPIKSREKGARGERELAEYITDCGWISRRGQQFKGGADSPDVVVPELANRIHFECKRVEVGNLYRWLKQAQGDAQYWQVPVVAHKRNGKEWVAIMTLRDFLGFIKEIRGAHQ